MSRPTLAGRGLVLLGIAVLAFNLRPAAVSVGPVLDEIRDDLGMSGTEAGILTSLPVIAFAIFGATAPRLAGLLGLHRLTLISLVGVAVGLFGRSQVDGVPAFLALSLLALAGMATANVLLPSLVRLHFPDRVGTITAVYTTALAIGLTAASVLTVPVSEQYDGWRTGLAVWAATAAIAVIPWLLLVRRDRRSEHGEEDEHPSLGLRQVGRTRLGRLMAAFFAFQSLQAYAIFGWFAAVFRDAGFSGTEAGLLLGVVTGVSIPLGFVVPALAGRMTNVAPIVIVLFACYPIGYIGMILAPTRGSGGLGGADRRGDRHLPADPGADPAAGPNPFGHCGALGVHPVGGLPGRGDRTVRGGGGPRRHRRLDAAAADAARAGGADPPDRPGGLEADVRGGRDQISRVMKTLSGSGR